jgi:hypothetical protein
LLSDFFLNVLDRIQGNTIDSPRTQFRGRWLAKYNYDGTDQHVPAREGQELIELKQRGNRVLGTNVANRKVRLRGHIRERYWTGTWHDLKDRSGYFGAFQLIMDADGRICSVDGSALARRKESSDRGVGISRWHGPMAA